MFQMHYEDLALFSRRGRVRIAVLLVALAVAAVWLILGFLQPAPPRRVVLASGAEFGAYHQYATRYEKILAREGVKVEERLTNGAADNLRLLLEPKSGVDVAFMQGGVAVSPAPDSVVMLASLYYEPAWVFYRDSAMLSQLDQLQGKRIAVGVQGSGTSALVGRLLDANGLTVGEGIGRDNTKFLRWRIRSRIYRWYGELDFMEHDIATRRGALPIETWLRDLERIEQVVERIGTPAKFASEAFTLREHVGFVRRQVLAQADTAAPNSLG